MPSERLARRSADDIKLTELFGYEAAVDVTRVGGPPRLRALPSDTPPSSQPRWARQLESEGTEGSVNARAASVGVRLDRCGALASCEGGESGEEGGGRREWDPLLLGCGGMVAVVSLVLDMLVMITLA